MTATANPATQRITLYFQQGSSDKVYNVAIDPSGDGFVVTFAFGRRGSTLQTGVKTACPAPFDKAKQIFDKLVREKTAKGYTPGEDGAPYQHTAKSDRATGIVPQLLSPIEECDVQKYIASTDWWAQEKFDGGRALVRRQGDDVTGINRQGLIVDLPASIIAYARSLGSQQWLIDGEAVGDVLYAFDILESAGADLRPEPYRRRLAALVKLGGTGLGVPIRPVETATTALAKEALLDRLKGSDREGIVFKRCAARHSPSRPASGGDWLKFKFTASVSCIVAGTNGNKRSVALELLDTRRISVGNVTIPPNTAIPEPGTVVEVRYLYAYPGGSLYQPVYVGVRDDLTYDDCRIDQLKFKPPGDEDEQN